MHWNSELILWMFGECFFMPKIFCNARNLKINSETPWKILNNLFTLTTTFTEVFVSSRLPLLWVIELSSVFFIVVSQFREHQRKKWYETLAAGSESEMQPNLGLYWTRRRGTCIELLNKFTSFQFSSLGRAFRMLVFFLLLLSHFALAQPPSQRLSQVLSSIIWLPHHHTLSHLSYTRSTFDRLSFYVNLLFCIVF